jgi:hypothetical protein
MLTYQTFFQSELEKLIKEDIERRKDLLVTASSTFDFASYRHHVGIIEGLRAALELIEETERLVNHGEQNR